MNDEFRNTLDRIERLNIMIDELMLTIPSGESLMEAEIISNTYAILKTLSTELSDLTQTLETVCEQQDNKKDEQE